ncbi:hypothetical protein W02_17960 [Nitrospira sp. KM1]|uniref:hypothetical protein n=1 Tax=Nitrospira sp. KM1 TaxID=1936990 RepID=UPI0013A727FF|nr:hypothetical protein [Nitrospira sp. KM1]BCA54656.1 hypothetical protein W02_17960 [Nitrospira sp. KM1]
MNREDVKNGVFVRLLTTLGWKQPGATGTVREVASGEEFWFTVHWDRHLQTKPMHRKARVHRGRIVDEVVREVRTVVCPDSGDDRHRFRKEALTWFEVITAQERATSTKAMDELVALHEKGRGLANPSISQQIALPFTSQPHMVRGS